MIYAAICDSNYKIMDELECAVNEVIGNKITFFKFNNPFALTTYVLDSVRTKIDVIFINTVINNQSGIEIIKEIMKDRRDIKVVFMSEKHDCITDIFQTNPMFFLKIPFDQNHVREAVYKMQKTLNVDEHNTINFISGRGGSRYISIEVNQIIYVESEKRKVHIYTENGRHSFYSKLCDIEKKLGQDFVRVHQSFIVNINKIKNMSEKLITLYRVDRQIPISRSRLENVERAIRRA